MGYRAASNARVQSNKIIYMFGKNMQQRSGQSTKFHEIKI